MDRRGRGRPKKIASDNFDQIPVKRGEDLPEFFKIYVPAIYSERLRIPPDFIEKFGGNIPETVTLKKTPGISFQADINRIDDDDDWFIEKGWPEFVKENSVEESDFLIFTYAGNAVFNVKVFSKNGCIKRVDNLPEDEPSEFEPESENSEDNQSEERNLSPRRPSERETVCGNRYFSVKLKKSCVTRGWLHIPSEFWRTHLGADKRGLRMVTLKLWVYYLATKFEHPSKRGFRFNWAATRSMLVRQPTTHTHFLDLCQPRAPFHVLRRPGTWLPSFLLV
ncbi:hypothetical protein ABFS82_02G107000 [Erythranthe guttata]